MDKNEEKELRKQAIQTISGLYPADSQYQDTAAVGQQLLEQAEREVNSWQNKPTNVLVRYAQLCEDYNIKVEQHIMRQNNRRFGREMGD